MWVVNRSILGIQYLKVYHKKTFEKNFEECNFVRNESRRKQNTESKG